MRTGIDAALHYGPLPRMHSALVLAQRTSRFPLATRCLSSARAVTSEASAIHTPVMLPEVLQALNPSPGGVYVDGTFGEGGHTRAILQRCTVFSPSFSCR